jgi:predicted metal-binding membrane protein
MKRIKPTWLTGNGPQVGTPDVEAVRLIEKTNEAIDESNRRYSLSVRVVVAVIVWAVVTMAVRFAFPDSFAGSDVYVISVLVVEGIGIIAWVILLARYYLAERAAMRALRLAEIAAAKEVSKRLGEAHENEA